MIILWWQFVNTFCNIEQKKTVARTVAVNYKPSSVFDGHLSSRIVANTVKRYF